MVSRVKAPIRGGLVGHRVALETDLPLAKGPLLSALPRTYDLAQPNVANTA
jgi:hypothetical protein